MRWAEENEKTMSTGHTETGLRNKLSTNVNMHCYFFNEIPETETKYPISDGEVYNRCHLYEDLMLIFCCLFVVYFLT